MNDNSPEFPQDPEHQEMILAIRDFLKDMLRFLAPYDITSINLGMFYRIAGFDDDVASAFDNITVHYDPATDTFTKSMVGIGVISAK